MVSLFNAGCKKKELEPTPAEPVRPAAVTGPALQFKPVAGVGEDAQEAHLMTQSVP
jgi:hypothetical protein